MLKQLFSSKVFVWIIIGVVVLAVGYGIFLAGSPATQRTLQFDQRRVSDLLQISFAVDEYWVRNDNLPEALVDLQDSRYYFVESIIDPATKELYEYQVLGEKQYELCATFELVSTESGAGLRSPSKMSKVWEHGVGRTCFELEIQPRIIPQRILNGSQS